MLCIKSVFIDLRIKYYVQSYKQFSKLPNNLSLFFLLNHVHWPANIDNIYTPCFCLSASFSFHFFAAKILLFADTGKIISIYLVHVHICFFIILVSLCSQGDKGYMY